MANKTVLKKAKNLNSRGSRSSVEMADESFLVVNELSEDLEVENELFEEAENELF